MSGSDAEEAVTDPLAALWSNPAFSLTRVLLGLIGVLVLFHALFVVARIDGDPGVFMTIGAGLLKGKLPYVDYIDHKPPGIYFLLAGVFAVARTALAAKLAILTTNLVTAGLVYWLATRLADARTGLVAVGLFLAGSLVYDGPHVYTEQFVALFGVLALAAFLVAERTGQRRYVAVTGLCVGLAILFKQPGLAFFGAFGAYLVLTVRERGVRPFVLDGVALAVGVALPLVVVAAFFASRGAFGPFLYWSLLVHFVGESYATGPLVVVFGNLREVARFPLLWILTLSGLALVARDRANREVALLGVVAVFALFPLLLRGWSHYYLQPIPFAALVSAYAVRESASALSPVLDRLEVRALVLATLLVLSAPFVLTVATDVQEDVAGHNLMDDQRIGAHIRAQTATDDPILTLGEQAKFYFLSNREPMNRHLYYLTVNGDLYTQEGLVRTMERKRVPYVVVEQPCHPEVELVCQHVVDTYELDRTDGSLSIYRRG